MAWPRGYSPYSAAYPPYMGYAGHAPQSGLHAASSSLSARDYAEEKPAAYRAFQSQAVNVTGRGAEVGLPNGMCQDRHVKDFLLCLECWLRRSFGDQPVWRLKKMDLSGNALSDEVLQEVFARLRALDIRVEELHLAKNRLQSPGLTVLTEYLWSCPDPLRRLDLSENELVGEVGESDGISGLFRCLYNHPSYPLTLEHRRARPLELALTQNYLKDAQGILDDILTKGSKNGQALIRISSSPDSYTQSHEEFLSLYLPGFLQQRTAHRKHRRKHRMRRDADVAVGDAVAPDAAADVAEPRRKRRKHRTEERGIEAEERVEERLPVVSEEEQQKLQGEVGKKLAKLEGLPDDPSTAEMLSEFTVCMLVARKNPQEVETELSSFIGPVYGAKVATWFVKHVKHRYASAAAAAGWS